VVAARETALRAHAKILEGNVPGRLIVAPLQLVFFFQSTGVSSTTSEHHFSLGDRNAAAPKAARARSLSYSQNAGGPRLVSRTRPRATGS